jgi:hypothetical protein
MSKSIYYISLEIALQRVEEKIAYHNACMALSNISTSKKNRRDIVWHGHFQRAEALRITRRKLMNGKPCNRSIAQIFGKRTRVCPLDLVLLRYIS